MNKSSKVLKTPVADSKVAYDYFCRKLALETDPSDVYEDLKKGGADFVLVDVRSPKAYARSHAVGAINIPHAELTANRLSDFAADTVFVVYCWGPGCNGADKAAVKFSKLGRPVKVMLGGIEYWEDRERLPVERE